MLKMFWCSHITLYWKAFLCLWSQYYIYTSFIYIQVFYIHNFLSTTSIHYFYPLLSIHYITQQIALERNPLQYYSVVGLKNNTTDNFDFFCTNCFKSSIFNNLLTDCYTRVNAIYLEAIVWIPDLQSGGCYAYKV